MTAGQLLPISRIVASAHNGEGMSSSVKSSAAATQADEIRMRTYRLQLQGRQEAEVKEIRERHVDEVQRLMDTHRNQLESLHRAYDVQISEEAERLEEQLHRTRLTNEERVNLEKKQGEDELSKLKLANQQRLDAVRKNGDLQIEKLRKELQATTEAIHHQAKKSARRERGSLPT